MFLCSTSPAIIKGETEKGRIWNNAIPTSHLHRFPMAVEGVVMFLLSKGYTPTLTYRLQCKISENSNPLDLKVVGKKSTLEHNRLASCRHSSYLIW